MQSVYKLKGDTSDFDRKIRKSKQNLMQFTSQGKLGMEGLSRAIGSTIAVYASWTMVISGAAKVVGNLVKTNMEFEQSNANLAAVLGTTRDNITALTEDAKRLGASTMYTASQVTDLQTSLAKLGFSQGEIKNATKDVLNFAAATGADLGGAADLCGAALRSFGLESKDMGRVASSMAVATSKSALSYEKLSSSLSTVAPVAAKFGFSIEDTLALLGKLSDAGFDASSAATATRNIFLNMADSSGKLATALGRPIKSLDDLGPALGELKAKGIDLAEMLELTDKRSVAAFATLVSGSNTLIDLRNSITDCDAALQGMVNEQMNTLQGSTLIMKSAWEGLMLSFSGSVNGPLKNVVDSITNVLTKLTELSNTGKLKKAFDIVSTTLEAATAAFVTYKVAVNAAAIKEAFISGVNKATKAIKSMNATLLANPYAATAAALAAIGVAIYKIVKESKELDHVTKTLEDVKKTAQENTAEEITKIEQLNNTLHDNTRSLDERRTALTAIQNLVPDYHGALTEEGNLINDNSDAISNYVAELQRAATAQAAFDKMVELQKKKLDKQTELDKEKQNLESLKNQAAVTTNVQTGGAGAINGMAMASLTNASNISSAQNAVNKTQKEIDKINQEIAALQKLTDAATVAGKSVENIQQDTSTTTSPTPSTTSSTSKDTFKFGDYREATKEGTLANLEWRKSLIQNSMKMSETKEDYAEMAAELERVNALIDDFTGATKEADEEMTNAQKATALLASAQKQLLQGTGSQDTFLDALTASNLQQIVDSQGLLIDIPLGVEVPDEQWEQLVEQINDQLKKLGLDTITLDVKTGKVEGDKKKDDDSESAADKLKGKSVTGMASDLVGALSNITSSLESMGVEIPEGLTKAINIMQSVLSIVQAINTIIGVIQTIQTMMLARQMIPFFAGGGVVHAANGFSGVVPGSSWSGDNIPIMANSGEVVLNRAQTANIAGQLQSGSRIANGTLSTRIKGGDILIALDNTNRSRGGSRGTYAYSK